MQKDFKVFNNYKRKPFFILLAFAFTSLSMQSCFVKRESSHHKEEITDTSIKSGFYETYSKKLNIKLSGTEDRQLIKAISEWLGTPYKYAGNTKQGTDCSGMTQAVYQEVYKISLYRSSFDQLKNVVRIDKEELKTGDLVFFITSGNKVSHVGIYISDNKFVHSSTQKGVIINDLEEPYYIKTFYSAGRVIKN